MHYHSNNFNFLLYNKTSKKIIGAVNWLNHNHLSRIYHYLILIVSKSVLRFQLLSKNVKVVYHEIFILKYRQKYKFKNMFRN